MQRRPLAGLCGLVVSTSLVLSGLFVSALGAPPAALAAGGWSAPMLINRHIGPFLERSGLERGAINSAGRIELNSIPAPRNRFALRWVARTKPAGTAKPSGNTNGAT